jgi:Flp pilus assembly protein TadD
VRPDARETYEKALAVEPLFAPAANNLAWLLTENGGDSDRALQLAQIAKESAPDDPRISDTLGWILFNRGVHQQALVLLRDSAAKLPDEPEVQYHLGMAYAKTGDNGSARKALTMAANSTRDFPGKDAARRALSQLN